MRTLDLQPRAPRPGSALAIERGCACPTIENNNGGGRGSGPTASGEPFIAGVTIQHTGWWVEDDCPLHGVQVLV